MRRRCLDCDVLRDDGPACPACGSLRLLLLPPIAEDPGWATPAALLAAHALLSAFASGAQPGFALGTVWFAEGVCAALLALGVERIPRIARQCVAASILVHLAYLVFTWQELFIAPGLGILVAAIATMQEDRTRVSARLGAAVGFTLVAALALGVVAQQWGKAPQHWWEDKHPRMGARR